jgi:hypothetical protein
VAQIVRLVQRLLRPQLILLKSRPLHKLLKEGGFCGADGVVTATERWRGVLEELAQADEPRRQQWQQQQEQQQQQQKERHTEGRGAKQVRVRVAEAAAVAAVGGGPAQTLSRKDRRALAKQARKCKRAEQKAA